jgi:hypothetical protein
MNPQEEIALLKKQNELILGRLKYDGFFIRINLIEY